MHDTRFTVPHPVNEPILGYLKGSRERSELKTELARIESEVVEIPCVIGGREIRTGNVFEVRMPHDHRHIIARVHLAGADELRMAIDAALDAKREWEALPWFERAKIFLKAADLLAGPWRARLNGTTMHGQSKNAFQAEIDAACELADFLRFNASFYERLLGDQPYSPSGLHNSVDYRPLEGFVFAVTPFNFTAIAGNLPAAPALVGNTIVWKPSEQQCLSAYRTFELFREAGLPPGVINFVPASGPLAGETVLPHPELAGVHFTGSSGTFNHIWKTVGMGVERYRSYPRIVGETGGKDFVFAHPSADPAVLTTALIRGAYEYQGQKCSAASRCYIPESIWPAVKEQVITDLKSFKMGPVDDFSNFINAVIDEKSFDKLASYIDQAKQASDAEIIAGGGYDKSKGWFIEPTVIVTKNPNYTTMCEELFGPVVTIYVYADHAFEETLKIADSTSIYALTGSIIAQDRYAIEQATVALRNAAGNFYINDKPTGSVVGQQPFGGARGSGTNDKAGSMINLLRWVSPRTIKETFVPPTDYRYPFLQEG